jgi:hypothetical protein
MGTIAQAEILINAQTVKFDSSPADNYYSFTMNQAGNILVSGDDIYGNFIELKIYDSTFKYINSYYNDSSSSISLPNAGTYYVQAIDSEGGSFTISSTAMSNIPIIITPPDEIIVEDTTHSKTLLTKTDISELYVALFGRASEKEGNIFWRDQGSIVEIADKMIASDAAKDYFGSSISSNQNFIEFIYANTLNKTVHEDPEGITYWVESLETHSRGEVVVGLINAISNYAPGSDVYNSMSIADKEKTENAYNQFKNRVEVSNYFADTLDNTPSDWKVSTSFNNNLNVTFDYNTVLKAKSLGDSLVNSVDTVIDGLYIGKYTGDQYGTINLTITETSFIGTWHNTLYGQSGKIYGSVDNVSGVLDIYSNELDGSPITFNGIVSNGYGSGTWDSIFYGNSGVFSIELI